MNRLEEKGLLNTLQLNINKCLKFEDLGTGCSAYFLGIEGGGVLSLYGQDYYEFDPIDDEDYDELDETNGIRVFPKTVIRLRYHKKSGELLEHTAEGKPIAPVEYEEPDYKMLYKLGNVLEDGSIHRELSLDEIENVLKAKPASGNKN